MQKYILISFFGFLLLLEATSLHAQNTIHCDYEIDTETNFVINPNYSPGDTICLMTGHRGPLYLKDIIGTPEYPIVIINKGGQSIIYSGINSESYGIKFVGSRNVVLSGAGDQNYTYGIFVQSSLNGFGLNLASKSTDFEIDHLEISHTKYSGIVAKTDPDCTYTAVRDSFEMDNIKIHDNYIHDTGNEGMYIGSSFFLGQYLSDCDTTVLPHIINGVEIYNNRIEYTGWDAIQVGSALYNCAIHDNNIYRDSQSEEQYQMSGIIVNTGSSCDVYNNKIINGKGTGIINLGTGGQKIFNNLIVNAGYDYDFDNKAIKQQHGIFSKYTYILPPDFTNHFYNNTIINPKNDGIRIMDSYAKSNRIINNLIINPGAYEYYENLGSTELEPSDAYIHNFQDESKLYSINNIRQRSAKDQFFVDTLSYDYHLTSLSPSVNSGYNLSTYGILFDIENNERPVGNLFDIGAYELQIFTPIISLENPEKKLNIAPNPTKGNLLFGFYLDSNQYLNLYCVSMEGKVYPLEENTFYTKGDQKKNISIAHLPKGEYILILYNKKFRFTQKIQKI